MGNAQDHALLALATRQGLLPPARAARLRELHRELGQRVPLAHLILDGQLISSTRVAGLLRELASGSFACARCAERLPYFSLAGLDEPVCPLCSGDLLYFPNPRERSEAPGAIPLVHQHEPEADTQAHVSEAFSPMARARGAAEGRPRDETQVDLLRETATRGWRAGTIVTPLTDRIGAWELLEILGRGGSGIVWHVRHAETGQEAALKLLRTDLADEKDVARFHLEAQVARRLRHPGLIPVFEAGIVEGRSYYVMELCRGQTLQQRLKSGPLEVGAALSLLISLSEAVAFAHEHGFIHRDLKPANVLLDPEGGRPRVTDFGLARGCDDPAGHGLTRTGEILGTPSYMAPEQFTGARVDERTDVHALGLMLYECLTGERAYGAPTVVLLAEAVCHHEPPLPSERRPELPVALDFIVTRALAKEPDARYSSALSLRNALLGLQRGRA